MKNFLILVFLFLPLLVFPYSYINAIAVQEDGKIVVGGYFNQIGGGLRNNIARLNEDGSLDEAFVASTNNSIYCLAIQEDGKIIIGGKFTQVNGIDKRYLARLFPDGSLDNSFYSSPDKPVLTIHIQADKKILIGGDFSIVSDYERRGMARIDQAGMVDTLFKCKVDGSVYTITIQEDSKILIGGNFRKVNDEYYENFARLDFYGNLDKSIKINIDYDVRSILILPDGSMLIGGCIFYVNGKEMKNLIRIYPNCKVDETFKPEPDGCITSILQQEDGKILLSGYFYQICGKPRLGIARIFLDGTLDDSFNPKPDDYVYKTYFYKSSKIFIIGRFIKIGEKERHRIALIDRDGNVDSTFNANTIIKWIQVATNSKGCCQSHWKTDLNIQNTSKETAKGLICLHFPDGELAGTMEVNIDPLKQISIKDIVGEFQFEISGALEVISNQEIIIGAKIYNKIPPSSNCYPNGTFSQYFKGYSSDEGISGIPFYWIVNLTENEFFRTNLHLTNIGKEKAYLKITLFDSEGNLLKEFEEELNPAEYKQIPQIFKNIAEKENIENGSIMIKNYSLNPIIASASLIDNTTNDAITIQAQEKFENYY